MPRPAVALAAALVLAGALSGCAHGAGGPGAGVVDPLSPAPYFSPILPAAATLIDADQTHGLTSMPWRLISISDAALTIQYEIGGGCDSAEGIYRKQTAEAVLVGAYSRSYQPRPGESCTLDSRAGVAVVPLTAPLGPRRLLHVAIARP